MDRRRRDCTLSVAACLPGGMDLGRPQPHKIGTLAATSANQEFFPGLFPTSLFQHTLPIDMTVEWPRSSYSQRKTFADSAVHTTNPNASAAKSLMCADHASPVQIP